MCRSANAMLSTAERAACQLRAVFPSTLKTDAKRPWRPYKIRLPVKEGNLAGFSNGAIARPKWSTTAQSFSVWTLFFFLPIWVQVLSYTALNDGRCHLEIHVRVQMITLLGSASHTTSWPYLIHNASHTKICTVFVKKGVAAEKECAR